MNKLIISLVALTAFSGVALADSASEYDREGIAQNFGLTTVTDGASTVTSPLAVAGEAGSTFAKVIMSGKGDGSDR